MIDFKNGSVFKLKKTSRFNNAATIQPLLVPGEIVIGEYLSLIHIWSGREALSNPGIHRSNNCGTSGNL